MSARQGLPGGLAERVARTHAEVDRRVRELVARIDTERADQNRIRTFNAAGLPPELRAKYGFGHDWTPRKPAPKRRLP